MSRANKVDPQVNRYKSSADTTHERTLTNGTRRALFVKNLSYNVSTEDLFDLFGKFGPIR